MVDHRGFVDLDILINEAKGVSRRDIAEGKYNFIRLLEYSRKYGIPKTTVEKWFRKGVLRGVRCGKCVFIVDEPPPKVERWSQSFYLSRVVAEVENRIMRATMGKPVALVKYFPPNPTLLRYWKRKGRLFKYKRYYYILVNAASFSLDEIKQNFPQPSEIMIPKPSKEVSWDEIIQQ